MVSFDAWKEGRVGLSAHEVTVVNSPVSVKHETVSKRLKKELIHPNRSNLVTNLHFSPDGRQIIGADYPGGAVIVWEVENGKQLRRIDVGSGLRSSTYFFAVSPDWRTVFAPRGKTRYEAVQQDGKKMYRWQFDGEVRTWNLESGEPGRIYKHSPPRNVDFMLLSPDGAYFIADEEIPGVFEGRPPRAKSLWGVKTGQTIALPNNSQMSGAFSPDGASMIMTTVEEPYRFSKAVKRIDTSTGKELWSTDILEKQCMVFVSQFSPDGRTLVGEKRIWPNVKNFREYRTALVWWDAKTGRELGSWAGAEDAGYFASKFSPDGKSLAVLNGRGDSFNLHLFRVADRKVLYSLRLVKINPNESAGSISLAISPDGRRLVACTQTGWANRSSRSADPRDVPQPRMHLIDPESGKILETMIAPPGVCSAPTFSPDGKILATGGLGRIMLWDMR